jgi:hypothetical protein
MDLVCLCFLLLSRVVFQLKTHGTCKQHLKHYSAVHCIVGPEVAYWLRHCTTSRTVPGSTPGNVAGDFFRGYRLNHVPWGRLSL